jgi:hypothetical protein
MQFACGAKWSEISTENTSSLKPVEIGQKKIEPEGSI